MNKVGLFGCLGAFLVAVLVVGGILAVTLIGGYNGLVSSSTTVDQKWSDVQVQYQRRNDLIGNLVKTVEGAANFEKSTLVEVTNARANATKVTIDPSKAPTNPDDLKRFQDAQNALSAGLGRLLAVAERYPDLKANQNFRDLQAELEGTENRIAVARRDFNQSAQGYNQRVRSFPTVLYAGAFGFQPHPYFQNAPGADAAPSVNFPSFGASPAQAR